MPTIGPLVAYPLTPRGEDGRLLTSSFEQLVDGAITAGANAVGVLGSTGGFAYMPRTARKRIARSAVETADGRVPVIVGVGALSTAEVLANLAEAHSVGAAGALLQPMAYQPLTFDEIYGLYQDASAATEIPLWVYNNPATTGHRFSVEQLAKIGRLSAVAGFKDRAANATDAKDRMERVAAAMPPRTARQIDWGFSGDGHGAQVLLAGATAWHSGLAGVLPEICVAIAQAASSGHAPHARVLQRQLTPLSIIVQRYGGIRTAHSIAQMLGLDAGVLPRPLAPLPADARMLVQMALEGVSVPDAPAPEQAVAREVEADDAVAAEQIVVESRAAEKTAAALEKAAADRAAAEEAAAERLAAERAAAQQGAPVPPAAEKGAQAGPATEKALVEHPAADNNAADKDAAETTEAGNAAEEAETSSAPEKDAPVARRAAPARTRSAARAADGAAPAGDRGAAQAAGPAAQPPVEVPSPVEAPVQSVRRPEPTKTGAVTVTPDPAQQTRPAPVRSDAGSVPAPRSLGRSRTEQPRRVRTPPTPVSDEDVVLPDEAGSAASGRHSG